MVNGEGMLSLPWLAPTLQSALTTQRSHALLVQGPRGVGQFELAIALAQGWLCEATDASKTRPCGVCASCKLVQAHAHPDMLVLLPEALREPLGWAGGGGDDEGEGAASTGSIDKAGKRKPSKDIRIDEVRLAVTFAQTTSARGRGKVVVLHPVERMNMASSNALLKTLEEPAGNSRLVLSTSAPDMLLPTIRSRCQIVPVGLPDAAVSAAWLAAQGVEQAPVLLAATGGQPQEALVWSGEGISATLWSGLPKQLARGDVGTLATWPLPRVIDMLQKLCHDLQRRCVGSAPRYFAAAALGPSASLTALNAWAVELQAQVRHAEHPWNAGLMVEALVANARTAMTAGASPSSRPNVSKPVSVN
jgi:DNA polymerase III subunit delta'